MYIYLNPFLFLLLLFLTRGLPFLFFRYSEVHSHLPPFWVSLLYFIDIPIAPWLSQNVLHLHGVLAFFAALFSFRLKLNLFPFAHPSLKSETSQSSARAVKSRQLRERMRATTR